MSSQQNNTKTMELPTMAITKPKFLTRAGPNDVILGRGAPTIFYEGNIRFRELVSERKDRYTSSSRNQKKSEIANEIITIIAERGGNFIRKVEDSNELQRLGIDETTTDVWIVVDDESIIQKVKQALRECRTSSKKGNSQVQSSQITHSERDHTTFPEITSSSGSRVGVSQLALPVTAATVPENVDHQYTPNSFVDEELRSQNLMRYYQGLNEHNTAFAAAAASMMNQQFSNNATSALLQANTTNFSLEEHIRTQRLMNYLQRRDEHNHAVAAASLERQVHNYSSLLQEQQFFFQPAVASIPSMVDDMLRLRLQSPALTNPFQLEHVSRIEQNIPNRLNHNQQLVGFNPTNSAPLDSLRSQYRMMSIRPSIRYDDSFTNMPPSIRYDDSFLNSRVRSMQDMVNTASRGGGGGGDVEARARSMTNLYAGQYRESNDHPSGRRMHERAIDAGKEEDVDNINQRKRPRRDDGR